MRVVIYTTPWCSYCTAAKALLVERGIAFTETDVSLDPALRLEASERSGRQTVPQIFIDGRPIGGYDELRAMDEDGGLDDLASSGDEH